MQLAGSCPTMSVQHINYFSQRHLWGRDLVATCSRNQVFTKWFHVFNLVKINATNRDPLAFLPAWRIAVVLCLTSHGTCHGQTFVGWVGHAESHHFACNCFKLQHLYTFMEFHWDPACAIGAKPDSLTHLAMSHKPPCKLTTTVGVSSNPNRSC